MTMDELCNQWAEHSKLGLSDETLAGLYPPARQPDGSYLPCPQCGRPLTEHVRSVWGQHTRTWLTANAQIKTRPLTPENKQAIETVTKRWTNYEEKPMSERIQDTIKTMKKAAKDERKREEKAREERAASEVETVFATIRNIEDARRLGLTTKDIAAAHASDMTLQQYAVGKADLLAVEKATKRRQKFDPYHVTLPGRNE